MSDSNTRPENRSAMGVRLIELAQGFAKEADQLVELATRQQLELDKLRHDLAKANDRADQWHAIAAQLATDNAMLRRRSPQKSPHISGRQS